MGPYVTSIPRKIPALCWSLVDAFVRLNKYHSSTKEIRRLLNSPNATTWNGRTAKGTDEEQWLVQSCTLTVAVWAMFFHPGYFVHILLYISLCLLVMLCRSENRPPPPFGWKPKHGIRNYSWQSEVAHCQDEDDGEVTFFLPSVLLFFTLPFVF